MPHSIFSTLGISSSAVNSLLGFSAFGVYISKFTNYGTAVWGLIAGVMSLGNFHLNLLQKLGKLDDWYSGNSLRKIKCLGILVFIAGLIAFIFNLTMAVVKNQGFTMVGKNFYTTVITNILTMFAGIMLVITACKYQHGNYEEIDSVIT